MDSFHCLSDYQEQPVDLSFPGFLDFSSEIDNLLPFHAEYDPTLFFIPDPGYSFEQLRRDGGIDTGPLSPFTADSDSTLATSINDDVPPAARNTIEAGQQVDTFIINTSFEDALSNQFSGTLGGCGAFELCPLPSDTFNTLALDSSRIAEISSGQDGIFQGPPVAVMDSIPRQQSAPPSCQATRPRRATKDPKAPKPRFTCVICAKKIFRKNRNQHMDTHNPNRPMFQCPYPSCGSHKGFTRRDDLRRHVRMDHGIPIPVGHRGELKGRSRSHCEACRKAGEGTEYYGCTCGYEGILAFE